MLDLLRANKNQYDWVWMFIHRVSQDHMAIDRAQQKFNIQLVGLQEHTIRQYREILEQEDIANGSLGEAIPPQAQDGQGGA